MQAAGLAGLGRIDADALLGAQECWTGGGESVNPIAQCGALARVADGEGIGQLHGTIGGGVDYPGGALTGLDGSRSDSLRVTFALHEMEAPSGTVEGARTWKVTA